jgi:peptidyl-prolyl cis-trans isomerase SurA
MSYLNCQSQGNSVKDTTRCQMLGNYLMINYMHNWYNSDSVKATDAEVKGRESMDASD